MSKDSLIALGVMVGDYCQKHNIAAFMYATDFDSDAENIQEIHTNMNYLQAKRLFMLMLREKHVRELMREAMEEVEHGDEVFREVETIDCEHMLKKNQN